MNDKWLQMKQWCYRHRENMSSFYMKLRWKNRPPVLRKKQVALEHREAAREMKQGAGAKNGKSR